MPILDIEIIASDSTESLPANLIQSLIDVATQVYGTPLKGSGRKRIEK